MAWVRTLNPLTAGGWEFRSVADDGSWATYSTTHQLKRSGTTITVWLRLEYAEPQANGSQRFLSVVQKVQYDCAKERWRALTTVYYAQNNLQGSDETEEADAKTAPWSAIIPGTRDELDAAWACGAGHR
ncbi:MAG: hypothetical protein M3O06_07285 [Pseudomonadota bacterium]|nr:hypothetical protein [Pseudomonadota bacterium]